MSSALYSVRMLWNGHAGLAKADGVTVNLEDWPSAALPGLDVADLDFAPEVRSCTVRERTGAWREMSAAERESVHAWLVGMAAAARRFINGGV